MSTDNPTLADFAKSDKSAGEGGADGADITTGARYGRGAESTHDAEPDDAGDCRNCGRDLVNDPDISDTTLRVIGDNWRRVPVCDDPDCRADYWDGATGAKETDLCRTVDRARNEVAR